MPTASPNLSIEAAARRSTVRIHTPAALSAFTIPWPVYGRDGHTVVIKATADLVPDGAALLRDRAEDPRGDVHVGDSLTSSLRYASDYAVFKPKCDVVLNGHAHPAQPGATRALVRFRFGARQSGFDRSLAVFGQRCWTGRGASPAKPLRPTPLRWEHAFGGPRFAPNPVGRGVGADTVPSIEDPEHLLRHRASRPNPAGFSAIPMLWKQRWSCLGTFDQAWFRDCFPYFPKDVDWAFFQSAPEAQQLERVAADAPYLLAGLHPDMPWIQGSLPGAEPRCFVQRSGSAGGGFEQLDLRLDTVAFDADELKVNLVWRGRLGAALDGHDVAGLFVQMQQRCQRQLTLEEARQRFLFANVAA